MSNKNIREHTLVAAIELINGERQTQYGSPHENFTRIATGWSEILGVDVAPHQVALCMTWLKICRLHNTPHHQDSWIDAAGYLGLGSELIDL